MAAPLYYTPGRSTMTPAVAREIGLGYAVEAGTPCAAMQPGPDGGRGVVFGTSPDARIQTAETLEWEQIPGAEVWLGIDPEDPPGPEDLARAQQLEVGYWITLGDGNRWFVPTARSIDGSTPLPRAVAWNGPEEGWALGDVVGPHRILHEAACRAWDSLKGVAEEGGGVVTLADELEIAAPALAANYRVGPAEISRLGLFTTHVPVAITCALIDWPAASAGSEDVAGTGSEV